MKRFFTFVAVAVFAMSSMMANWHPSDTESTRLDKEGTNGQVQMKTLRTDDGKIILSWLRPERINGDFSYVLHLQIFDADGNAMFGDEGIIVCDKMTRSWTTDYALELASNGDILLGYTDVRNDPSTDNAETYLYRYNQQGQPVWDADGLLFPAGAVHENPLSVEDVNPIICVSGDNIYAAVNHTEYYMEKANEDNWSPSPWFPNQQMPDSVLVNESKWLLMRLNQDGTAATETPMTLSSRIMLLRATYDGMAYLVYDNEQAGLDGQLLDGSLTNVWDEPVTIEQRSLSGGMFMPTPLAQVDIDGVLNLSYRVLSDFYGYQVANFLSLDGETAPEAHSLAGGIDGDAGTAAMGVKDFRALTAWEYAYSASEYRMNVNVVDNNNNYSWSGDMEYGVTIDVNDTWGFTPVKVIPVTDGWVILYGNSTSWNGAKFMVVKIDDFGGMMWSKQICEDDFKSSGFSVTYDENNAYIFYTQETQYDDNWNEIPGSAGMYVMCVDITGHPTSISEAQTSSEIVKTEIFTVDGRRVDQLQDGVNIVRTTDAEGHVKATKVLH